MKRSSLLFLFASIVFSAGVIISLSGYTLTRSVKAEQGFVVLEFFTSEGCSSCPPAEKLVEWAHKKYKDEPVYILAYHVDYWNKLGWTDVFSDSLYTKRQQRYAERFRLNSVYTPQIVVNGHTEFVGSEEATLKKNLKENLSSASTAAIQVKNLKVDGDKITVEYSIPKTPPSTELMVAVVEKSATSKILGGENKGKTLAHVQIVRHLDAFPIDGSGKVVATIQLPAGIGASGLELVSFVQRNNTGEIFGASKVGVK